MDNLYEDESMMEPVEPITAVTSEEKKVKKPKPVGQPRKEGEVFFIPESESTPYGMVDFVPEPRSQSEEASGAFNYDRAQTGGVKPDKKGKWGSVVLANEEEKKLYQLPQGSYYSLKGKHHETIGESIKVEKKRRMRPVLSTTIVPLAPDASAIKGEMGLRDNQAQNLERLRTSTDDFYLPENMKSSILGQIKSESSYNKDAVGDRGRAFGYLQLRGPRLKFFLENYYGDNEGILNILKEKPKLNNLSKNEQGLIVEAFRNDPDNEKKTFKYFIGELNPNNQEMPKYYNIINVPTNISGMNERRQAEFNRLYNNNDTSVDDWNKFFTLEYTRSGAALSKRKGVSEEQIKNRLGESKTISNNVSKRSFIKNMSGRFFDGLKRAGIYSEESK